MMRARKRFAVWLAVGALMLAAVLVAPEILPHSVIATDLLNVNQPPSADYPLGTDAVGRCILCRTVAGMRTSLLAALAVVALCAVIGSAVGSLSGFLGGAVDLVVMRVVDAFMAFPSLVLAIVVAGLFGGGLVNAVLALALAGWPQFARVARSQVLAVARADFALAGRMGGLSASAVALAHVLPNCLPPLVVTACVGLGGAMLNLAGLSFLGLGAAPPAPELGSMISQAAATFQTAPWAVFAPGAAILLMTMVLNMLGDSANDALEEGDR